MKKLYILLSLYLLLADTLALAHHPAAEIVDAEIYAMIDSMVASTPHADLDFDDTCGDVVMTITTRDVEDLENMVDDNLVTYAASLSRRVSVEIELNGGGGRTILTVTKIK